MEQPAANPVSQNEQSATLSNVSGAPSSAPETPVSPPPFTSNISEPVVGLLFGMPNKFLAAIAILIVTVVALGVVFLNQDRHVAIKQFTNVYSFVPEKISKSAPIRINVPEGVSEEQLKTSLSFSPEVKGEWQVEEIDNMAVYQPDKPLRSGVYYAVNLDTEAVQMSGDFFVDEDPKITAVFPALSSESHEDTEISIIFNRPMVTLAALTEERVEAGVPVTISPETPGTFRWVSTRNLQFIPDTTLIPASKYTVTLGEGFVSVDGLAVAPLTHTFNTRQLRYQALSEDSVSYRSPFVVRFNQPVDLSATARKIAVSEGDTPVKVDVEYGEVTYYDRDSGNYVTEEDQSIVWIYQNKDRYGRARLWDFDTTYKLDIAGAVPLVGTTDLREARTEFITVPTIVSQVSATSERTDHAVPDLFDPQGTLEVSFYESVDLSRLRLDVKGLQNVEYAEKCKEDEFGNTLYDGSGCEKESDNKKIIFTFKESAFAVGEQFTLTLEKVYNTDGLLVNEDDITISLGVYPQLEVSLSPGDGEKFGDLDGLTLCSTVPLKSGDADFLMSVVDVEGYIVYGEAGNSRTVSDNYYRSDCKAPYQFETTWRYGILPNVDYNFNYSIEDVFGQKTDQQVAMHSKSATTKNVRFQNLQKQYNVTPPERTKLTYVTENLESVQMQICKLSPEVFLETMQDRPDSREAMSTSQCQRVISETVALPARYWVNNYFQVDLKDYFPDPRGQYVLSFKFDGQYQDYDHSFVSVTNLAVGKKEVKYVEPWRQSDAPDAVRDAVRQDVFDEESNLYWVTHNKTLTPLAGAQVTQYTKNNATAIGFTNTTGLASVSIAKDVIGAVVRNGADTAVITNWSDTLNYTQTANDASRTYIYTDRPIYRPGDVVHIKGIDRIGYDGAYDIVVGEEVLLTIKSYGGRGTEKVFEVPLTVSAYGTFDTEFTIPQDASLGQYTISAFDNSASFSVEEYVPAAFKLDISSDDTEITSGDTLSLDVQADYYFGVPLSEGTVTYSVTSQDYYFDRYTDEYFRFGGGWYYCYSCGYGDNYLFRGEADIDTHGRATIERQLDIQKLFSDKEDQRSKLVTFHITAKDANGRSVSGQKTFIVHKGEYYIGAKTDRYYTSQSSPVDFKVKTVDQQGEPQAVRNLTMSVNKVKWNTFKRQEVDGGYYYRSEKEYEELETDTFSTDRNGDWNTALSFDQNGHHEIVVRGTDSKGNVIETTQTIYIYGGGSVYVPPKNNYELDIEVEKSNVSVGDTASVLIQSPHDTAKALITVERGYVYDQWVVDVKGGLYLHEFPVKPEYAPNFFVTALLISNDPEVHYGSVPFTIGQDEQTIDVSVTPNKDHYLPGEQVELAISAVDSNNQPVVAEVSVAVADLSVLALKGNPKKSPVTFFYNGFPLTVTTASNIKHILHEVDVPLGTKGGGGGDPADLAAKKRGEFKDTAYWQADVVTNSAGTAVVRFTLPDNLTTWQVESLAVTKDTKLGVEYNEFTTKKDVMAIPLKPRFVVPGDRFSLGANVFNQSDSSRTFTVSLESDTLAFLGDKTDKISLGAGESKTVYFEVEAPETMVEGVHRFTFTATDGSLVDSVEQTIAITPNTTYETVATAGFTSDNLLTEFVYVPPLVEESQGGLTINANATMAVFLKDAKDYMARYPYGCSEQLSSALSTIGTLTSALDLPNVEGAMHTFSKGGVEYTPQEVVAEGLQKIYNAQKPSGGFAYYPESDREYFNLTIHVLEAMDRLADAGYDVDRSVMERAMRYVEAELANQTNSSGVWIADKRESIIAAEYVLKNIRGENTESLVPKIMEMASDNEFLTEKISSTNLAYLSIITAQGYPARYSDKVYDALQNRIDIDGRGAYLGTFGDNYRYYYGSPEKNTALLLRAFVAHEDIHPMTRNVQQWLLRSRDNYGAWGGTHKSYQVVAAFVDYLSWSKETESHFALRGTLDGDEIFTHEFSPRNIFEQFTHFVPMRDLQREKLLPLTLEKTTLGARENNLYYDMALRYYLSADELPPRDEGITITRTITSLDESERETNIAKVGEVLKGKLTVTIPNEYQHVVIEDMIPAGFEIVNFNLATEDRSAIEGLGSAAKPGTRSETGNWLSDFFGGRQTAQVFGSRWLGGRYGNNNRRLYPSHIESHDDRVFLYAETMRPGVYEYEYYIRALVPGEFRHLPARAEDMFYPEIFGRTSGGRFTVTED